MRRFPRSPDLPNRSEIAVAAVVVLLYAAGGAAVLVRHDWNPTVFPTLGDRFADPAAVPPGTIVLPRSDGYDGQFYYRFALAPFSTRLVERGILVDYPSYRHQRILLPLLAWAISGGGRPALVPWALLAVQLGAAALLAGLGARFAAAAGRSPWWGLALALSPNFLLTFRRNLVEILAAALVLAGVAALRAGRARSAGALLSLAVLARETTLLVPLACAAIWIVRRLRGGPGDGAPSPAAFLPPMAAYAALAAVIIRSWGEAPLANHPGLFDLPYYGLVSFLQNPERARSIESVPRYAADFVLYFGFVFATIARRDYIDPIRLAVLLEAALYACVNELAWRESYGFLRGNPLLFSLGWVLLFEASAARRVPLALLSGAAALATWVAWFT